MAKKKSESFWVVMCTQIEGDLFSRVSHTSSPNYRKIKAKLTALILAISDKFYGHLKTVIAIFLFISLGFSIWLALICFEIGKNVTTLYKIVSHEFSSGAPLPPFKLVFPYMYVNIHKLHF